MIYFILNGKETAYAGALEARLLDVLRDEYRLTGVKCGCKEGECGACSIILDGKLVNSCLVAMGRVSGCRVVTIEGYRDTERFAALSRAYAETAAVQCGFCTPGMVLASECILARNPHPSEAEIREGISGNLCRCTGYNAIVQAVAQASQDNGVLWEKPEDAKPKTAQKSSAPAIPGSLAEALALRAQNAYTPYGGGTDLLVEEKRAETYLFLHSIPELKRIAEDEENLYFGAGCTFTELLENSLTPPILKEALAQIAAPAIRNEGTIGGNIANGTAKADSALIFFVTDSRLKLAGPDGERVVPVKDFYLGRKKLDLRSDELIAEIQMPKKWLGRYYYEKVGGRKALAISRLSFAGLLTVEEGKIAHCAAAFGAVSDVIIRRPDLDAKLIGLTIPEARSVQEEYLKAYDQAIQPTTGRVSAEYRKTVCLNLLRDFLEQMLR